MMSIVTPEQWYRAWWLAWTVAALIASHYVIVRPIVTELRQVRQAIERQTELMTGARVAVMRSGE